MYYNTFHTISVAYTACEISYNHLDPHSPIALFTRVFGLALSSKLIPNSYFLVAWYHWYVNANFITECMSCIYHELGKPSNLKAIHESSYESDTVIIALISLLIPCSQPSMNFSVWKIITGIFIKLIIHTL